VRASSPSSALTWDELQDHLSVQRPAAPLGRRANFLLVCRKRRIAKDYENLAGTLACGLRAIPDSSLPDSA
jgi:hypothetical protein